MRWAAYIMMPSLLQKRFLFSILRHTQLISFQSIFNVVEVNAVISTLSCWSTEGSAWLVPYFALISKVL